MQVTLNTPPPLIGLAPPAIDAPQLPRGAQPLPNPLTATVVVDGSLLQPLLAVGFTVNMTALNAPNITP